jgi:hypothetical protein
MARPKGPAKRRITVTILETACEVLDQRRGSTPLPTYLAENIEQAALPNHVKVSPGRALVNGKSHPVMPAEVEPRFKKAGK